MRRIHPLVQKYGSVIRDTDQAIRPLLEAIDIHELARHNMCYRHYHADRHHRFIEREKFRFLQALEWIEQGVGRGSVCDLGCFIPYLPVALAKVGFRVKIVDKFRPPDIAP